MERAETADPVNPWGDGEFESRNKSRWQPVDGASAANRVERMVCR